MHRKVRHPGRKGRAVPQELVNRLLAKGYSREQAARILDRLESLRLRKGQRAARLAAFNFFKGIGTGAELTARFEK